MTTDNDSIASRRTVVGYFANGEDAARAIDDLITEGFRPSEIGAAFHQSSTAATVSGTGRLSGIDAGSKDMDIHPAVGLNSPDSETTSAGAGSDSNAVTPAGLSTGAGTGTSGASRPGPIPGSEIPSSLPSTLHHSIPSTLPSTLHPAGTAHAANENAVLSGGYPATGAVREGLKDASKGSNASWWDKLKNVFSAESSKTEKRSPELVADKSSTNFGTGEGHLGVYPDEGYAYSGVAFESAFFGMGVAPTYAKQLTGRIQRGGAIVTVESGSLNADAEKILERNGGNVHEETSMASSSLASEDAWTDANQSARVHLFGKVQHVYPGYVSSTGEATRKAS